MQNMEEIYKEYFKTVNKYLFCLTHNDDISEELTQETFYRAVIKVNAKYQYGYVKLLKIFGMINVEEIKD